MRYPKYMTHLIIGVMSFTCFVCFDRNLGVSSLAQSNDADAIRSLVGRLFDLYQKEDLEKLISLFSRKSTHLELNKQVFQWDFGSYEKIVVKDFEIRQMKIDGDKATLRVTAEMALTRAYMVKPSEMIVKKNRTIDLVNEVGIWKVWKFFPPEEKLADAIDAAKTEEERKALMEQEPELMTSDLAVALCRKIYNASPDQVNHQRVPMLFQLVSKLTDQVGDQWLKAITLINTGYFYVRAGYTEKSHELALEYYRKSLRIGEQFGFKDVITQSLLSSAVVYQALIGDYTQAEEFYQNGLKQAEEWGNYDWILQAINNLGTIYNAKANYAKALEMQFKNLKISESRLKTGDDWWRLSMALQNISNAFGSQSNYEQALAYSQRADKAADTGIKLGDGKARSSKAYALNSIGGAYQLMGNNSFAMDHYQKTLKLVEEVGNIFLVLNEKDSFISSVKTNIGDIFFTEKKVPEAIASYQEALQMAEKSRDKTMMSRPLLGLSNTYLLRGDFREALTFADRAVKAAEEIGQYRNISGALVASAKAYLKLGQPEEARRSLTKAIDIIEKLRDQLAGGEIDRQRFFEYEVTPYQIMIDLHVDQKRFTEAFSYTQRAKARTLLELLQIGRVNLTKSSSPPEREQEQQLTRKIVSLNRQVTSEKLKSQPDEKRIADFDERLKKARLEFEAFHTTFYAAHPELKVHRGEVRPVSFDDAVTLIPDPKTVLLDFIVTDENVHLFVLTKDPSAQPILNTYTIKIERKALAEKVERYRGRMENRDYDFQALSQELYVLLLKPAQKQLQNKTNLIISPDNVLWDLPFQTLLSPELRYLFEDAAISYAPSLSVLREMRLASKKKQAPAKASILALGNPALGTRSRELAKFVKMDAELQPLPEAAAQVRALGRLYGKTLSQVLTGPAAREELVKERSARYRILHLATHGILNDASPMYSHVLLSQTLGKTDEDGMLEAWEMMNLDLNADLVVLAACETARGRVGAGEGVIGMSWALFVAGCPRTVVSQWKVEASSTTALMVEFHKRFKTRYGGTRPAISTAEAMRQAALKVMKNPEYAHPFYWGGFVVIGDGN
jgi:CHAT domain-containing protein